MMKKRLNRKGFTMAELLVVVGIILVLAAVGFIALMSHMRNMQKLEMDGQAKEIFVAAQNHLAMAGSQDYLGKTDEAFGSAETKTVFLSYETSDEGYKDGVYYFVVNATKAGVNNPDSSESVLKQMLPFASVDEGARTKGSYIIRYQKESATILDVFYVGTSGRYGIDGGLDSDDYAVLMSERSNKTSLKNYGRSGGAYSKGSAVVGYYGGVEAVEVSTTPLLAPIVEVINAEKLQVKVTNPNTEFNTSENDKKISLTLIITDSTTGRISIDLITNGSPTDYYDSSHTALFTLDDVTSDSDHFCDFYEHYNNESDSSFVPLTIGDNIKVEAVAYNNNVLSNIAKSGQQTTNSLFAKLYENDEDSLTAEITNFRHLLNLDAEISGLEVSLGVAEQKSDLDWLQFLKKIDAYDEDEDEDDDEASDEGEKTVDDYDIQVYSDDGAHFSAEGRYMPIRLSNLEYKGNDHQIVGVVADSSSTSLYKNAGLFASLSGCEVSNLELIDFKISVEGKKGATAADDVYSTAGALAGTVSNSSTITGVLVRNSTLGGGDAKLGISTADDYGGNAGGLIGSMNGGNVDKCAAAVYVSSSAGDAGGLIGSLSGTVTVSNSYAGGHTDNAQYIELLTAESAGRVNVQAAGAAGGLIGDASAATLTLTYSYSTASAQGGTVSGGLIGAASATTDATKVSYCYAIGKVFGATKYTFVGTNYNKAKLSGTNYYLESVTSDATGYGTIANLTAVNTGDEVDEFLIPGATGSQPSKREKAVPYDRVLSLSYGGEYLFPTVAMLHDLTGATAWSTPDSALVKKFTEDYHFGDWQLPGLSELNYVFLNDSTLNTQIELKGDTKTVTLALYGETSNVARIYVLSISGTTTKTAAVTKEMAVQRSFKTEGGKTFATDSVVWTKKSDFPALRTVIERKSRTVNETTEYYDLLTVTLDSISTEGGHFVQLFADSAPAAAEGADAPEEAKLLPGENVTLYVASGEGSLAETMSFCGREEEEEAERLAAIAKAEEDGTTPTVPTTSYLGAFNPYGKVNNSLFAFRYENSRSDGDFGDYLSSTYGASADLINMSSVDIKELRHLQNLDTNTSYVNMLGSAKVTTANLRKSLNWNTELPKYANSGTVAIYHYLGSATTTVTTADGTVVGFNGIFNPYLTKFDGHDYTLSNFIINNTSEAYSKLTYIYDAVDEDDPDAAAVPTEETKEYGKDCAGFFRFVINDLEIDDLRLHKPTVNGVDAAGALVAKVSGTNKNNYHLLSADSVGSLTLDTVLAEGETATVKATVGEAGGLVGVAECGTLTINNSAAAVYVEAGRAAGGLVGQLSYCTVSAGNRYSTLTMKDCYVGGHTVDGKYSAEKWNIISNSDTAAAGGILGQMAYSSNSAKINTSFNAASVYASSGVGGGIVGSAAGNLSGMLDVYVVAPVNGVKLTGETGNAGAVVGVNSKAAVSDATIFYLPAVYSNLITGYDAAKVKPLGSGEDIATVTVANYYAHSGEAGYDIIGLSNPSAMLESATTAYDAALTVDGKKKEYPFSIWTKFNFDRVGYEKVTHFYGDWEPANDEGSRKLYVSFTKEFGGFEEDLYNIAGADTLNKAQNKRTVAVQIEDTVLAIPTVPYLNGYYYGSVDPTTITGSPEYDYELSEPVSAEDAANGLYVWELYFGTVIHNEDGTRTVVKSDAPTVNKYSSIGDPILIKAQDIEDAQNWAKDYAAKNPGNGTINGNNVYIILNARYYKLPGVNTVTLMDYDPNAEVQEYARMGGIQTVPDGTDVADVYPGTPDLRLTIPRRIRPNYTFLGWYTGENGAGIKVFEYKIEIDSETGKKVGRIELTDAGKAAYSNIKEDITLYAHYEAVSTGTIYVDFILANEGATSLNMEATSIFEYDKDFGLDIEIPLPSGINLKGTDVKVQETSVLGTEGSFNKDTNGNALSVHLVYNGKDDERHYSVYLTGQSTAEQVGYVVRYQMMNTSSVTGTNGDLTNVAANAYAYDSEENSSYSFNPFAVTETMMTNRDIAPTITGQAIPGFFALTPEVLDFTDANKALYKVTDDECTERTYVNAEGETVPLQYQYIIVVTYEREEPMLTFDTGENGDYFPPEYLPVGTEMKTILSDDNYKPSRTGYDFVGWTWSDNAGGGSDQPITVQQLSTTNLTMPVTGLSLTAVWNAVDVDFTVLVWAESAVPGENYELKADAKLSAKAGTEITVVEAATGATVCGKTVSVTGDFAEEIMFFHLNEKMTKDGLKDPLHPDVTPTVKGDGSTIINVYLDRNEYTLRFYYGFLRNIQSQSGYKSAEQYPDNTDTHYAKVGSEYVELTPDGEGGWLMAGMKRVDYTGDRYKTTTSNTDSPQYGVVNNQIKELSPKANYSHADSYYYYRDTTSGTGTFYILTDQGLVQQYLYKNGDRYYKTRSSNRPYTYSQEYTGPRFKRGNRGNNWTYENTIYYLDASGNFVTNGSGTPYKKRSRYDYYVKQSISYNGWTYDNGTDYPTNSTRYLKVENSNSDTSYTLGFYDGAMNPLEHDSNGWYYMAPDTDPNNSVLVPLSQTYIIGFLPTNNPEYCVSNQNDSSQDGKFSGFFTNKIHTIRGTSNPFEARGTDGKYLYNAIDYTSGGTKYIVYYTDLKAKYGTYIANQWPAGFDYTCSDGNYDFIGWHVHDDSYLYKIGSYSSIKTKYETMSSDIITDKNGNAKTSEEGITHILRCRYAQTQRHYIYRWYMIKDPSKTNLRNLTESDYEVNYYHARSGGSVPNQQTIDSFIGYSDGQRYQVSNPGVNPALQNERYYNNQAGASGTYSQYNIRYEGQTYSGMLMNYYYWPKVHSVEFFNGIDNTSPMGTYSSFYGDDILNLTQYKTYANQLKQTYSAYYDFDGWYDDPYCSDGHQIFDKNGDFVKMITDEDGNQVPATELIVKDGDVRFYAKMTHKKVQVTFNLNGAAEPAELYDFYHFDWTWGTTLDAKYAEEGAAAAYQPTREGYEFKGWFTEQEGGKRFSFSRKIGTEMEDTAITLYAHWAAKDSATAPLTIYYIKLEEGVTEYDVNDSTLWLKTPVTEWKNVRTTVSMTAPAANTLDPSCTDYFPVNYTVSCTVRKDAGVASDIVEGGIISEKNRIIFIYRQPETWQYRVEYYIHYADADYQWALPGDFEYDEGEFYDYKAYETEALPSANRFEIIRMDPPEDADWLKGYELGYYTYNVEGTPAETDKQYSPFLTIAPDASKEINVVRIYLIPDSDAIPIDDYNVTYNGSSHWKEEATYRSATAEGAPIWFPSGATVTVHYLCYTDNEINTDVVDADTYGMRAFITIDIGSKTLLIWQSEDYETDTPPLHLYVNRRMVILHSDTSEYDAKSSIVTGENPTSHGTYANDVLRSTTYVECAPGASSEAQIMIASTYSALGLDGTNAGFATDADRAAIAGYYEFSANAFRRMNGTSKNIFTCKPPEALAKNYIFYIMYGELTVKNKPEYTDED